MLAETATREFSKTEKPNGFDQNISVAKRGGKVAGDARKAIEEGTGRSIITSKKAAELNHVVTQMIEASANAVQEEEMPDDTSRKAGMENEI